MKSSASRRQTSSLVSFSPEAAAASMMRLDCLKMACSRTFLTYLPLGIQTDISKLRSLSGICKTIKEKNSLMLLLGEKNDHADLAEELPAIKAFPWLDRPLNNDTLGDLIEKLLEKGAIAAAPAPSGEKKRILIVDDDPSYAGMVREWIKDSYKADIVTAGMQAISFLLKRPVDLILLDYEMPVVNGPQVLQMLRQEPTTEHIPVVFLTGVGTKEQVSQVLELKPDGYILKSTTRVDLLAYLKSKLS